MRATPRQDSMSSSQTVTLDTAQSDQQREPPPPQASSNVEWSSVASQSIMAGRGASINTFVFDFVYLELGIKSEIGYDLISMINDDPGFFPIVQELRQKKQKLESHLASQVGDRVLVTSYADNHKRGELVPMLVRADTAVDKAGFTDRVSKLNQAAAALARNNYAASVEWREFCGAELGGYRDKGPVNEDGYATYRQMASGPDEEDHGAVIPYTDVSKVSNIIDDPDGATRVGKKMMRAVAKLIHSDGGSATIPMNVYISNSSSYDTLYLDPIHRSRLLPSKSYAVEHDRAYARYDVRLTPEEAVIARGGHFKDALARESMHATKADIMKGITDATTGTITNGSVITDADNLRNRPLEATVTPGNRELVMKVSTYITLSSMVTGNRTMIPAEYVVIVLETEPERKNPLSTLVDMTGPKPLNLITGVVVFIITIIPTFLPEEKLRFTGMPPNPYADEHITGIIQAVASNGSDINALNRARYEIEEEICNTDGRTMLMVKRQVGSFPVTYSVEMEDVHVMSPEFRALCTRLFCNYADDVIDEDVTSEQLLKWVSERMGPFVGVDEQIWHPNETAYGLRKFSAEDVITRWVMAHLCYLGTPGATPGSPDVLRILNPKQALLASVPACVAEKCLLVYSISPAILSLFTNGGVGVRNTGADLPGGLRRVTAGISNRRKSRTLNRHGLDMSYLCPVFCGPERIDELPRTRDGSRLMNGKRHVIVRPDGTMESWDNVLYEMGCALYSMHQERHSRDILGDVNGIIWTPTVIAAVSVAKEGTKVGVTGYLCTGGRPSRITPSGHDPKRVIRESDATRVHSELLTESGGMGYMKSLLEARDVLRHQIRLMHMPS